MESSEKRQTASVPEEAEVKLSEGGEELERVGGGRRTRQVGRSN